MEGPERISISFMQGAGMVCITGSWKNVGHLPPTRAVCGPHLVLKSSVVFPTRNPAAWAYPWSRQLWTQKVNSCFFVAYLVVREGILMENRKMDGCSVVVFVGCMVVAVLTGKKDRIREVEKCQENFWRSDVRPRTIRCVPEVGWILVETLLKRDGLLEPRCEAVLYLFYSRYCRP